MSDEKSINVQKMEADSSATVYYYQEKLTN